MIARSSAALDTRAPARRRSQRLALVLAGLLLAALSLAPGARADAPAPWWHLSARPAPSYLPPSGQAKLILSATNMGNAPTSGPITITDKLPANVKATTVLAHAELESQTSFCAGAPSSQSEPS